MLKDTRPTLLVRSGTILFAVSIAFAYALYPHWITLSDFALRWYTLIPFIIAMFIAMFELWYIGTGLHKHSHLKAGASALDASTVCTVLILCIPYMGGAVQKDIHDAVAVLFVIFAAVGFALVAKRTRYYSLGWLSGGMFGLCALELIFLARYKEHPVYPWVWTVMELAGVAMMMVALNVVAKFLEL